jgi:hypothetical protein
MICQFLRYNPKFACDLPAVYQLEVEDDAYWLCAEHYDMWVELLKQLKMKGQTVEEYADEVCKALDDGTLDQL